MLHGRKVAIGTRHLHGLFKQVLKLVYAFSWQSDATLRLAYDYFDSFYFAAVAQELRDVFWNIAAGN